MSAYPIVTRELALQEPPKPERTKHRTMKILTVYYSMYGHVLQLARAVEQGAKAVAGVDVILRRVAEFDDVIKKTADNEYIVKVVSSRLIFRYALLTISGRRTESSSARRHATAT